MPWKECNRMDERLRFVARLLDGEKMAVLCREFGISRKTGYKIFNRYKDFGLEGWRTGLEARIGIPTRLPFQVETAILSIKREHTTWGAPKIREKLIKDYPMIKPPAQHDPRHPGSPWPGHTTQAPALQGAGNDLSDARHPMHCGVPITRASSCWVTAVLLSAHYHGSTGHATCWPVKAWSRPGSGRIPGV